jgi:anthranilate synthase component II
MKVLIIDNYDSFTYNLYQYLSELGAECVVVRNDAIDVAGIRAMKPDRIVLSPGPGRPENARDFGICAEIITELAPTIPTLGVCLGHQGIVHHLGGRVIQAPEILHGKTSIIRHSESVLFQNLPDELEVMRYHSLLGERTSLPDCLAVTAETVQDHLIMAVEHRTWPLYGIQFHPESIGTPAGRTILENFLTFGARSAPSPS